MGVERKLVFSVTVWLTDAIRRENYARNIISNKVSTTKITNPKNINIVGLYGKRPKSGNHYGNSWRAL